MIDHGIILGNVLSFKCIKVDYSKIDIVHGLLPPITVREFHYFLGHACFYRRFIKDFLKIARQMWEMKQKDISFIFKEKCKEAFENL